MFYFKCIDPEYVCYLGKDKEENEELIKYSWPEDVWFHVDKHSSAHLYLRLKPNETIHSIPPAVLEDMAQYTKENSIEGKKLNNIRIVYTMASNLKKTGDMATGAVGYHDPSKAYYTMVLKKNRDIVNRIKKTKVEDTNPNLQALRDERDKQEREAKKKDTREKKLQEKREIEQKRKEAEAKSYDSLFSSDRMRSNKGASNSKAKASSSSGNKKTSNKTGANNLDDVFGDGDEYDGSMDMDDLF